MLAPYWSYVRAQDTTLRVSMWDGPEVEPQEREILEGFTEQFSAGVDIEFNPADYDTKLLSALSAGTAPDVYLWWNYPALVSRGGLEDITPYVEGSSPLDLNIYYQPILDVARINGGLGRQGNGAIVEVRLTREEQVVDDDVATLAHQPVDRIDHVEAGQGS